MIKTRRFSRFLTFVFCLAFSFFLLEAFARTLTDKNFLQYHTPFKTLKPKENLEDWRLAHTTVDKYYRADPILFWKPKREGPYNSQGFKGKTVAIPKPKEVFRIIAYGDSNTEGPLEGGWLQELEKILNSNEQYETHFEVLNAGVSGYSSYQGLMRFRQEIERYSPDLVFISFGWNDAAPAIKVSDNQFVIPHPIILFVQRMLVHSRLYLTIKYYLRDDINTSSTIPNLPRVSVEDYAKNMMDFDRIATQHSVQVLFLTRPHQKIPPRIHPNYSWRKNVPSYNQKLLELPIKVINIQSIFKGKDFDYFSDECHFSSEGHIKMAQVLASRLSDDNLLGQPT